MTYPIIPAERFIRQLIARAGGNPNFRLPPLPRSAHTQIMVQKAADEVQLVAIAPPGWTPAGTLVIVLGMVLEVTESWVLVQPQSEAAPDADDTPVVVWAAESRLRLVVRGNRVWVQGRLCAGGVKASLLTVVEIGEDRPCTTK